MRSTPTGSQRSTDRKSTRLNSSHTVIYTLSLHDALPIYSTVNAGACLSQPGPLINTLNPSTHAINAYRIPALYGRHRLALTNTTSTTAYRGAGRPNVSYLVERLVDEAAH